VCSVAVRPGGGTSLPTAQRSDFGAMLAGQAERADVRNLQQTQAAVSRRRSPASVQARRDAPLAAALLANRPLYGAHSVPAMRNLYYIEDFGATCKETGVLMISAASASELFVAACQAVLAEGRSVAPRGMATVEVLGASLCLTDPRRRLVDMPPVRVLNPAFAAAEAVWILSGSDEPWIYQYNRRLTQYADGGRLMGAYGPRLRYWQGTVDQLDQIRKLLRADPGSRRAVIQLFDPGRDFAGYNDVPCTLGYRFFLRDGLLHMHTTMRSQDLWLGFGYDIFTATMIQELLAGWLGAGLGEYCHQVDSLHLYAQHVAAARRLPSAAPKGPVTTPLAGHWDGFDGLLHAVITGGPVADHGWAEIATVLASYRAWKTGDREKARLMVARSDGLLSAALQRWYDRLEHHSGIPGADLAGRDR
jgi:thymidylate synthase